MSSKRGRPKGLAFKTQENILLCLDVEENGLNLKTIVRRTQLNKKTVIKTLKKFIGRGFIKKRKVGRYSIYTIVRPKGSQYCYKLRLGRTLKQTKPFRFDRLIEKRARKFNIKFAEIGERLLRDYPDEIVSGKNFDLTLRGVISEIIEERKRKREIDLG
jgi:DNA-binding MarR family transcriptional regulator